MTPPESSAPASGATIGIIGAGGIGGYYAALLSRAGVPVRLIARGHHLAAICARGLEVRAPNERFVVQLEATDDGARLAGCDYVIVAVKGYSLPEIGASLVNAAESGASIVPLLNGVDVVERMEALGVPRAAVIGGLARVSVLRSEPGVIERKSPFDQLTLGELDRVSRERTTRLASILGNAGATTVVSDDIVLDLWRKFAFIVSLGVVCGLSRQPAGQVFATERGRELTSAALSEIVSVGRARGVAFSDADEARVRGDLFGLPPAMRPSFLADLERGGPTEVDLLSGAVSRLGRLAGVPTPVNDVAATVFEIATLPSPPA